MDKRREFSLWKNYTKQTRKKVLAVSGNRECSYAPIFELFIKVADKLWIRKVLKAITTYSRRSILCLNILFWVLSTFQLCHQCPVWCWANCLIASDPLFSSEGHNSQPLPRFIYLFQQPQTYSVLTVSFTTQIIRVSQFWPICSAPGAVQHTALALVAKL